MKIKRLGRTGLKVSEICLGTMTFGNQCDEPASHAIMDRAFEHGVTHYPTRAGILRYARNDNMGIVRLAGA
jgi:aryl-alcohol dehydrogenase-like predicted oxidoreductase